MPGNGVYSGRYLVGDSYGELRRRGYGDPGLGALISAALPFAGKAVKAIGSVFKKTPSTAITVPGVAGPTVVRNLPRTIGKVVGPVAAIGAGTAAGELALSMTGYGGAPRRKYKRMNPLNPKALKRACKRMDGFRDMVKMIDPGSCGCSTKRKAPAKRKRSCR